MNEVTRYFLRLTAVYVAGTVLLLLPFEVLIHAVSVPYVGAVLLGGLAGGGGGPLLFVASARVRDWCIR